MMKIALVNGPVRGGMSAHYVRVGEHDYRFDAPFALELSGSKTTTAAMLLTEWEKAHTQCADLVVVIEPMSNTIYIGQPVDKHDNDITEVELPEGTKLVHGPHFLILDPVEGHVVNVVGRLPGDGNVFRDATVWMVNE